MKLTAEQNHRYYDYIVDCIDLEPYDITAETRREKIQALKDIIKSEKGREPDQLAVKDWLQGLPTIVNIEWEDYEILQLAKRMGSLSENPTEKEEDKILGNYWAFMASKVMRLINALDSNHSKLLD